MIHWALPAALVSRYQNVNGGKFYEWIDVNLKKKRTEGRITNFEAKIPTQGLDF